MNNWIRYYSVLSATTNIAVHAWSAGCGYEDYVSWCSTSNIPAISEKFFNIIFDKAQSQYVNEVENNHVF